MIFHIFPLNFMGFPSGRDHNTKIKESRRHRILSHIPSYFFYRENIAFSVSWNTEREKKAPVIIKRAV